MTRITEEELASWVNNGQGSEVFLIDEILALQAERDEAYAVLERFAGKPDGHTWTCACERCKANRVSLGEARELLAKRKA